MLADSCTPSMMALPVHEQSLKRVFLCDRGLACRTLSRGGHLFESAWSLVVCSAVLAFPPPPRSARSLSAPRCLAAHPAALKPVCLAAVPTQRSFCHSWQGPCPRACPAPLRARDRMLLLSTCPERVRSVFWFWQRCTISRCSALAPKQPPVCG